MKPLWIILISTILFIAIIFSLSFFVCDAIVTSFNRIGTAGDNFENTVLNFVNYSYEDIEVSCSILSKEIVQSEFSNEGLEKINVFFTCEQYEENNDFNFSFYTKDNKVYLKMISMGPCNGVRVYYNEDICSKDVSYCRRILKMN